MAGRDRLRRSRLLCFQDGRPGLGGSVPETGAGAGRRSGAGRPAPLPLPVLPPAGPLSRTRHLLSVRNRGYFADVPRPRAPSSPPPQKQFPIFGRELWRRRLGIFCRWGRDSLNREPDFRGLRLLLSSRRMPKWNPEERNFRRELCDPPSEPKYDDKRNHAAARQGEQEQQEEHVFRHQASLRSGRQYFRERPLPVWPPPGCRDQSLAQGGRTRSQRPARPDGGPESTAGRRGLPGFRHPPASRECHGLPLAEVLRKAVGRRPPPRMRRAESANPQFGAGLEPRLLVPQGFDRIDSRCAIRGQCARRQRGQENHGCCAGL